MCYFASTLRYLPYLKVTSLIVLLYVFTVLDCVDYWYLNLSPSCVPLNSDNMNALLTNSINKYHPFIFYSSLTLFTSTLCLTSTLRECRVSGLFYTIACKNVWKSFHEVSTLAIVGTLYLGSWWAVQEGSWGG